METHTLTMLDIPTLTTFFMWCTVISVILMAFWAGIWFIAPDLVYKIQAKFMPMERETWNLVFYCFLGVYKLLVIVAFIIPWIALLIMG